MKQKELEESEESEGTGLKLKRYLIKSSVEELSSSLSQLPETKKKNAAFELKISEAAAQLNMEQQELRSEAERFISKQTRKKNLAQLTIPEQSSNACNVHRRLRSFF